MMMMSGRNLRRMRTSILALATMVVALSSGVANASYVAFDPISGFDNSSLGLSADYQIPTAGDWLGAGVDGTNGIFIEEVQCLKQMMIDDCAATLPAGTDGYFSQVTWTLSNTSGMSGPGLLFISGLNSFDPMLSASYDPADIKIQMQASTTDSDGLDSTPMDFEIASYSVGSTGYFYLAYKVENFTRKLHFTYKVDALQLDGGTPQLFVNSAFNFANVPEPSTGLLVSTGLLGLSVFGRRRKS